MTKKVCIVGAGPSGVAACTMMRRYKIDVLLFEHREIGGILNNAWRVENFPTLDPVPGTVICQKLKDHLDMYDVPVIEERVIRIRREMIITDKAEYSAEYTVVATGTKPKRLANLEASPRVVYEYRDIPFDAEALAVYGAGDMALDGAVRACTEGKKVYLFSRGERVSAVDALRRAASDSGVRFCRAEPVRRVEELATGLKIITSQGSYEVDALLICIGREPALPEIDSDRYEIIGDARGDRFRQASIAVGEGIRSAMRIASEWW